MRVKVLKLLTVFLFSFCFISGVSAKTFGQLKSEFSKMESDYKKNQENKEQTQAEINAIKNKISSLNMEKYKIQDEIKSLNEELTRLNEDIDKMRKEIKAIVNYYQLSNSESLYLEYVFNASSLTDFIYRLAITEQLSEYRTKKIDEFNKLIDENKKKVQELADKQVELNKVQNQLSQQLSKLGNNLSAITEEAISLKDEIVALKKQINLYQNTYKCKDNEELTACMNRYNQNNGGGKTYLPSAAGFYRPLASGALNYEYGYTQKYGANHEGIDFSIGHGTPVYSVANGVVVSVWERYWCGGNMVFIGHDVNGKRYTSLYAHLASINVSVGQQVTYNTLIGYTGGAPWIETWDACSTGPHLHFQMSNQIYMIDYLAYSRFMSQTFNPRDVINFPDTDVPFYSR